MSEREVRSVLERFRRGWELLDADEVLATLARQDLTMYGTDAGERWDSYESLAPAFHAQVEAFESPRYAWGSGDPGIWVRGDAAWARGDLRVSLEAAGERIDITMRSTFVLTRNEEGWRIHHAHFSIGQQEQAAPYG